MLSIACFISVFPVHKLPEAQWAPRLEHSGHLHSNWHVEHVSQFHCCFVALVCIHDLSSRVDLTVEVIFHLTLLSLLPFIFLPLLYARHYIYHLIKTSQPPLGNCTIFVEVGCEGDEAYSLNSHSPRAMRLQFEFKSLWTQSP